MALSRAERMRRWRERHPEQSREGCRDYHAQNREAILQRKREYYQRVRKEADKTDAGRLADRNRKARRRALTSAGTITQAEWGAILEAHDHSCAYCGASDCPLEMDHVRPLSKGGAHVASNIVPACKPCNSRKGAR